MKKFSKKTYFIVFLLTLTVLISVYMVWGREKKSAYDFVVAGRGNIVQEVSVTGRVRPAKDVDLAFVGSGRVSGVYVDVGDRIFKEKLLVQQENADILAQLQGAEATLKAEQAKLIELEKGTRPEEIEVQKVKVANARVALADAQQELQDDLEDVFTKADDAIRNKVDQFFSNPKGSNPELDFSTNNLSLEASVESERVSIEYVLINWISTEAKENLNQIKTFLDNAAFLVNDLTATSNISQTTIDGWKADVSTARTNINTAISNLSTAKEGVRTAESNLALAEEQLALQEAGTVKEKILAQEAVVEKAQAEINKHKANLAKTVIRSPISGIVTKQEAEVGEIVSANTSVVSIISEANFEIESDIPEVDVAKIKLGDVAKITLDAYGDDVFFSASIVAIDPAETIIEGVPSYGTTLQFSEEDVRIRSGMTANLDILTEKRENVIVIPQRAVITQNGNKFVRILENEEIEEREVQTGLRNSYGEIEIIRGISAGEKVVTFIKQK